MSKFDFLPRRNFETFGFSREVYEKGLRTIETLATSMIPIGTGSVYRREVIPLIYYIKADASKDYFRFLQKPKLSYKNGRCEFTSVIAFTLPYTFFIYGRDNDRFLQVRLRYTTLGGRIKELLSISMKHVVECTEPIVNGFSGFEERIPTLYMPELNTLLSHLEEFKNNDTCDQEKLSNLLSAKNVLLEGLDLALATAGVIYAYSA